MLRESQLTGANNNQVIQVFCRRVASEAYYLCPTNHMTAADHQKIVCVQPRTLRTSDSRPQPMQTSQFYQHKNKRISVHEA